MAKYFKQDISTEENLPRPDLAPLTGLQLARRGPIVAAMRAQDRVLTTCRRIVLRQGLSGAVAFLVPDTDPSVGGGTTHPDTGSQRITALARIDRTPGCFLRVRALCAMSGDSQHQDAALNWVAAGGGALVLSADFRDAGGTVSVIRSKTVPVSPLEFGAAPSDAESQWKSLRLVEFDVKPPLGTSALVNRWSLPSIVTLGLIHREGLRVIDCTVEEYPHRLALEADDTATSLCAHNLAQGNPSGAAPPFTYPLQRLDETSPDGDPRGGTWQIMDVANAQANRLGPVLVHWTAYDEDDEAVSMTDVAGVSTSSTTFVGVQNVSLTSYDADVDGFSLAAGAYARTRQWTDPVGMSSTGVIPVRVRVYCATGNGTTTGVLRFQSGPYQWVDVVIPANTTFGWRNAFGFARVGRGPGQPAVAQMLFRRTAGASTITVRHVSVHHSSIHGTAG